MRMKKIYTLPLFLVWFIKLQTVWAQAPIPDWSRCYGGDISDWGEYVFPLQDGGAIVTGSSYSNNGDVSGHHSNGIYLGYDYWVARVKGDGTIKWQKSYGGTLTDLGRGIVQPDPEHFVISGYAWSNDYDISGNHGDYDLWLMKIDTAGDFTWGKTYGGSAEDDNWDLIETADHGFMLTGATLSVNGDVTFSHGAYDSWVVKTDSNGILQWQKTFGGTGDEYFNQTIETADGNYLSVGRTFSNNGDVNQLIGYADVWAVKYDLSGNIIWEKTFGGTDFEEAQGVVAVPGGGYVIAGTSTSNNVDVTGNHGSGDIWVLAIDELGNLLWQHCYGGTYLETSWGITAASSGYIVSGESYSADGDVTTNYGNKDGWIIGIDFSGNLLWEQNFGGSGEDWMRMVKPVVDGSMYAIGTSASADHDANNAHGDFDFFMLKFLPPCLPVIAAFNISQNGLQYQFTDNSANATNWFWDFGDGDTITAQNPVHEYAVNGTYTICLIASDSCSSDTLCQTIKVFITSGNSPISGDTQLSVFPNPFSDHTTIQFSNQKNEDLKIDLLDMVGRKIKTLAEKNFGTGNHSLNFQRESLRAGMYLLQLKNGSGISILKLMIL